MKHDKKRAVPSDLNTNMNAPPMKKLKSSLDSSLKSSLGTSTMSLPSNCPHPPHFTSTISPFGNTERRQVVVLSDHPKSLESGSSNAADYSKSSITQQPSITQEDVELTLIETYIDEEDKENQRPHSNLKQNDDSDNDQENQDLKEDIQLVVNGWNLEPLDVEISTDLENLLTERYGDEVDTSDIKMISKYGPRLLTDLNNMIQYVNLTNEQVKIWVVNTINNFLSKDQLKSSFDIIPNDFRLQKNTTKDVKIIDGDNSKDVEIVDISDTSSTESNTNNHNNNNHNHNNNNHKQHESENEDDDMINNQDDDGETLFFELMKEDDNKLEIITQYLNPKQYAIDPLINEYLNVFTKHYRFETIGDVAGLNNDWHYTTLYWFINTYKKIKKNQMTIKRNMYDRLLNIFLQIYQNHYPNKSLSS